MKIEVKKYLAKIGSRGGRKSRRHLSSDAARGMVKVREARRAFRRFYVECFWSFDPRYRVTSRDIAWVSEQLKKNGGAEARKVAIRLCP